MYVWQGRLATGRVTLSPKKSHLPLPLVRKTGREAGLWKRDAEGTPVTSSSCGLLCLTALDGARDGSSGAHSLLERLLLRVSGFIQGAQ